MHSKSRDQFQRLAESIQQGLSATAFESVRRAVDQYERNWSTSVVQASAIGTNVFSALSADQQQLRRAFETTGSVAVDLSKIMATSNVAALTIDESIFRAALGDTRTLQQSMTGIFAQVQPILDDINTVDWTALQRSLGVLSSALSNIEAVDYQDETLPGNVFDETGGVVLVRVATTGEDSFQAAQPAATRQILRLNAAEIHLLWIVIVFLPSIIAQSVPDGQDWFNSPAGQTFMNLWIPVWIIYRERFKSYLEQIMDDE
jgi:hypothetical protein